MIEKKKIYFRYKGGRSYVHGTDIYNSIVDCALSIGVVDSALSIGVVDSASVFKKYLFQMTMRGIIFSQCEFLLFEQGGMGDRPNDCKVEFQFVANGNKFIGCLVETGEAITESYVEDAIVSGCCLNKKQISLDSNLDISSIEIVVAMNKALLSSLFPTVRSWFFSRLELTRLLSRNARNYRLKVVQSVGDRFVKSEVFVDNSSCGCIYFSGVES